MRLMSIKDQSRVRVALHQRAERLDQLADDMLGKRSSAADPATRERNAGLVRDAEGYRKEAAELRRLLESFAAPTFDIGA
jgi:hypothetical protein